MNVSGRPRCSIGTVDAFGREHFGDRAARAAGDDVLLDRDDRVVRRAPARSDEFASSGFTKRMFDDGRVELLAAASARMSIEPNARIATRCGATLALRAARLALADRQRAHAGSIAAPGPCRADSARRPGAERGAV